MKSLTDESLIPDHNFWMNYALKLALKAEREGEVPVGAVLVKDNQVIGEGWNQSITLHDPSAHAEIMALRAAGKALENYRLPNSTLYVTLEPCLMCAGSLLHARVERLVFAAYDPKTGALGSAFNILSDEKHYHSVEVISGIEEAVSRSMIQNFFKKRRRER